MKKLHVILGLLFVGTATLAQEVVIPQDLKLESEADYQRTESLVLSANEWLQNTPVNQNPTKRAELNGFLMKWMMGSPSVSIELVAGIVPMDCSECLMSFMSGWVKYSLDNEYSKDKIACAVAGAEQVIEFYKKNKSELGKFSEMKKLMKKQKKGKLKDYIESKFE